MEKKPVVCQIDEKGNVLLPAEFQDILGYGAIELVIENDCIILTKAEPIYTGTWDVKPNRK